MVYWLSVVYHRQLCYKKPLNSLKPWLPSSCGGRCQAGIYWREAIYEKRGTVKEALGKV
jgi:hypothetical protein